MRILITNDDGINAPGLQVLHDIASELAGNGGAVTTVAPAFEQSGVGHCISYTQPTMIAKLRDGRYAAEGSPADCVLAGLHDVMTDAKPDLILSGVNRGNNSAENAMYSGTLGAAIEGALQGVRSIALSQYIGPANNQPDAMFDCARQHGADVVRKLLDLWPDEDAAGYGLFWNVNFPPCAGDDARGLTACAQGYRGHGRFTTEATLSPNGRRFLWVRGGAQHDPTTPGTDAQVNLDNWISATPMRADLTDHGFLEQIKGPLREL